MRKSKIGLAILGYAILATSCTTTKSRTFDYDYMFINKQGVIQRPLITDLEVAKQKAKITKTYDNTSVSQAKETIMGEFIQENNCDLIIQPYFMTSTVRSTQKTTLTVTLTGFAASYKNIRQYEPKDTLYLLPRAFINNELNKPLTGGQEILPKKNSSLLIVLTVIGAAVIAGVISSL